MHQRKSFASELPKYRISCVACKSKNIVRTQNPVEVAPFITNYVFGGKQYPALLMSCQECGMLFFDISYTDHQMKLLYSDYRGKFYAFFRDQYEPGYMELNNKISNNIQDHHNKKQDVIELLNIYARNLNIKRILDYGGDRGQNILDLPAEKFVYEVSAVPNDPGIQSVQKIENQYYDVITCMHLLEHLGSVDQVLKDIKDGLTDDGVTYFEVPLEIETLNPSIKYYAHEHINFYNVHTLNKTLESNGFSIIFSDITKRPDGSRVVSALAKKHKF